MTPTADDTDAPGFELNRPIPKVYYADGEKPEPFPLELLETNRPPLHYEGEKPEENKSFDFQKLAAA